MKLVTHLQLPTTGRELSRAVSESEYKRLLRLPKSRDLDGDLLDRSMNAREWYSKFGTPFAASSRMEIKDISDSKVLLANGIELHSLQLAERLRTGEAHALVLLAASAGAEVAHEIANNWAEGRPDAAFFLDRFAAAVTEALIRWSSAFLCRAGEPAHETLLPHLSPGCGDWDLSDQHRLMAGLSMDNRLGPIELLPSGALRPQYSVLAALGVTRLKFDHTPKDMCRGCDLDPCAFRRAPFAGNCNASLS